MDALKTGKMIATLRKQKGLTQQQLAKELNVSNKTISKWETGEGYPDITNLPILAQVLDVTVDELVYGEKVQAPIEPSSSENQTKWTKKEIIFFILEAGLIYSITMAIGTFIENIAFHKNIYIYGEIRASMFWLATAAIIVMLIFKQRKH